jgi:hypothetical protein
VSTPIDSRVFANWANEAADIRSVLNITPIGIRDLFISASTDNNIAVDVAMFSHTQKIA